MRDSEPADYEAVALIKSALSIPVFANGGCKSYSDALEIARITKADGSNSLRFFRILKCC